MARINRTRDPDKVALGRRIKILRKERKLTQEGLAERAGLDTKYIAAIEQGDPKANPTFAAIKKVAAALGVTVQVLFQDWDSGPVEPVARLKRQIRKRLNDMSPSRISDLARIARVLSSKR